MAKQRLQAYAVERFSQAVGSRELAIYCPGARLLDSSAIWIQEPSGFKSVERPSKEPG